MGGLSSAFDTLLSRFPSDMGEIAFWAVLIPVGLIVLFLGRYVVRGMVNRRVHSIERATAGFGGLEEMRKKGLITEEEYRAARKKAAERIVENQKEETAKQTAGQVLAAIDQDPALARKLIPESSPRARAALAGLGKKVGPAEEEEPGPPPAIGGAASFAPPPTDPEANGRGGGNVGIDPVEEWMARTAPGASPRREAELRASQARVNANKPGAGDTGNAPAPRKAAPTASRPAAAAADACPLAPVSAASQKPAPPSFAPAPKHPAHPPPAPERRESGARIKDLEGLLARGLITQEEYQRLAGFVRE